MSTAREDSVRQLTEIIERAEARGDTAVAQRARQALRALCDDTRSGESPTDPSGKTFRK